MKSTEIKHSGFYWWSCPKDDGPRHLQGTRTIVKADPEGRHGWLFLPGDPATYNLRNLPGEFQGPIQDPEEENNHD